MRFKAEIVAVFLIAAALMTGCGGIVVEDAVPDGIKSDYYVSLAGGAMYIGQEASKLELYTKDDEEEGRYVQNLGLYDIKIVDNKVTEIRTASSEIKLSSELYVGQTKESLESYLTHTVKYIAKDRVLYYDSLHGVAVEVSYNKDDKAKVIRFKAMIVQES